MTNPFLIVAGNPVDGFSFIGPFEGRLAAIDYGEQFADGDWWIAPIDPVEEQ
jgi:hypothetical protein